MRYTTKETCPHGVSPAHDCTDGCGRIADRIYQLDKSPHPSQQKSRAESRELLRLHAWWDKNVTRS